MRQAGEGGRGVCQLVRWPGAGLSEWQEANEPQAPPGRPWLEGMFSHPLSVAAPAGGPPPSFASSHVDRPAGAERAGQRIGDTDRLLALRLELQPRERVDALVRRREGVVLRQRGLAVA